MKPILLSLILFGLSCGVAIADCHDGKNQNPEEQKIDAISADRWDQIVKKHPVQSGLTMSQQYFKTNVLPDGFTSGLTLTIVAYVSKENRIVLALTLAQHQVDFEKTGEMPRLKYFLLGKPFFIQDDNAGPIAADRTKKIIAGLKNETILDFFQTNQKDAQALHDIVLAPK